MYSQGADCKVTNAKELRNNQNIVVKCNDSLSKNPKDLSALTARAFAYGRLGLLDKSIEDCDNAIRLDPNCARAYANLGWTQGSRVIMWNPSTRAIRQFH